jgi:hypothetical protein
MKEYDKFSDRYHKNQNCGSGPAKAAKAAKVSPDNRTIPSPQLPIGQTLATLATLAEVEGQNRNLQVIAPTPWFQGTVAPHRAQDPPYDQPCPYRRGHIERSGAVFLHFCIVCGAWGAFGYGITEYHSGRWYCSEHRPKK